MEDLHAVMLRLIAQQTLEENYIDHELSGAWKSHRDCHIRPDWILIYRIADDTITFERTGTHSDLFE